MTLFMPDADDIGDSDVPVECPQCGLSQRRVGLTQPEKQFLIDSTLYHRLCAEYRLLLRINEILTDFPGTRHPLLADKVASSGARAGDDGAVDAILDRDPELREFLQRSHFRFDRRFAWVDEYLEHHREVIARALVRCPECEQQSMVLDEAFYARIGFRTPRA
ncbi:hypothetical protein Mal4_01240 [Maioricimonas rarisocia]|uniref:Uncharacterized protein n=1 Tax=Maioricimonas rarisocia TaxID=2528026 RepID=A0A517Z040_9PLAN|nr:hypothetical protein [Maioricimonas rarisocia]QDU35842.1 hypothetical protein Mal4_01240 [Maioricimonas rarisocia]